MRVLALTCLVLAGVGEGANDCGDLSPALLTFARDWARRDHAVTSLTAGVNVHDQALADFAPFFG